MFYLRIRGWLLIWRLDLFIYLSSCLSVCLSVITHTRIILLHTPRMCRPLVSTFFHFELDSIFAIASVYNTPPPNLAISILDMPLLCPPCAGAEVEVEVELELASVDFSAAALTAAATGALST